MVRSGLLRSFAIVVSTGTMAAATTSPGRRRLRATSTPVSWYPAIHRVSSGRSTSTASSISITRSSRISAATGAAASRAISRQCLDDHAGNVQGGSTRRRARTPSSGTTTDRTAKGARPQSQSEKRSSLQPAADARAHPGRSRRSRRCRVRHRQRGGSEPLRAPRPTTPPCIDGRCRRRTCRSSAPSCGTAANLR